MTGPGHSIDSFRPGAQGRLTDYDLPRFPGDTLFDKLARAVCAAGCLPRKELYEAWEVARRVRRLFRGGRIVDLAAGHGLLAQALLLLDNTSPLAVAVDRRLPPSARKLQAEVTAAWPRLAGRVSFLSGDLDSFAILPTDVVVSAHACGALTDVVIERAASAGARLAVLPCCHHHRSADARKFAGWMDGALAIDVARAQRLELAGYRVWTQALPAEITPKGRLLLARRLI